MIAYKRQSPTTSLLTLKIHSHRCLENPYDIMMQYYTKGANAVDRCRVDVDIRDYGPEPLIVNIDRFSKLNQNYRSALWTGQHLQVTLMSIKVGGDIGLEMHPYLDQFLRVESGCGLVKMGNSRDKLNYQKPVDGNYAIIIPAGTWHNLINTGSNPLKLYSIYAPPQHPFGTVHKTKEIAEEAEEH